MRDKPRLDTLERRVEWLRTVSGRTGRGLDKIAGLHQGHIWAIEHGRSNLEIDTAEKLARTFGVSLDWLVRGLGERPDRETVVAALEIAERSAPGHDSNTFGKASGE